MRRRGKEGSWAHRHQGYMRFWVGFCGVLELAFFFVDLWGLAECSGWIDDVGSIFSGVQSAAAMVGVVALLLVSCGVLRLVAVMSPGTKRGVLLLARVLSAVGLVTGALVLAAGGSHAGLVAGNVVVCCSMGAAMSRNINDLEVE